MGLHIPWTSDHKQLLVALQVFLSRIGGHGLGVQLAGLTVVFQLHPYLMELQLI